MKHCGKISAPAPAYIRAAIGKGDGRSDCRGVAAAAAPIAVRVDVLVIRAVDAARDVAAVLARHAVSGAALPPDAPPQPLQHRSQSENAHPVVKGWESIPFEELQLTIPAFWGMAFWGMGPASRWTPFSTPRALHVHTERAEGGLRIPTAVCLIP